jgi:hypothetical protein
LKLAGEEDEKLRHSPIETKKGRSAIAVAAQITTSHPVRFRLDPVARWDRRGVRSILGGRQDENGFK